MTDRSDHVLDLIDGVLDCYYSSAMPDAMSWKPPEEHPEPAASDSGYLPPGVRPGTRLEALLRERYAGMVVETDGSGLLASRRYMERVREMFVDPGETPDVVDAVRRAVLALGEPPGPVVSRRCWLTPPDYLTTPGPVDAASAAQALHDAAECAREYVAMVAESGELDPALLPPADHPGLTLPGPPNGSRHLCPLCPWYLDVPAPEVHWEGYEVTAMRVSPEQVETVLAGHFRAVHGLADVEQVKRAIADLGADGGGPPSRP